MIPLIKPALGEAEAEAARRAILSGWVTQGPEVAAFEAEFAAYVGSSFACAVSNCTTALHLALLTVGVGPGDEVVTVSHTYIATANAVRYCGAEPVFTDIEPDGFNIDPLLLEDRISERTRAILCVHQAGMPCDMAAILGVARRHNLPVIEDAACAIGSEINMGGVWEKIGKPHGDIACFSFHPRKVITTGDGGMITTANERWDARFRNLRQHGMSVPDTVRHGARQVIFEDYPNLGYNYRMTDIQAAVGREQLKRLDTIVEGRRRIAKQYESELGSIEGLRLPSEPAWARSNWQSYCVTLPEHCDQRDVMQTLLNDCVVSRRGIMCCHREAPYCGAVGARSLKRSERAQDRAIILPLFGQMTEDEVRHVSASLKDACKVSRRVNVTA